MRWVSNTNVGTLGVPFLNYCRLLSTTISGSSKVFFKSAGVSRNNYTSAKHYTDMSDIGCCSRFGRGACLYHHRVQLFEMLWVRLALLTGQFSEIKFSAYNVWRGWFTSIELVLDPTTRVYFLLVQLDSIV